MNLPRPPRLLLLIVAAVVAVLASGLGATGAFAYAGDIPRGTTVLGVDIGAKTRTQAVELLTAQLDQHAEALVAPVPMRVGEVDVAVDPAEVGLAVDVEATVDKAIDQRVSPISALFGNRELTPVVNLDPERLDELLAEPAEAAGAEMTMPEIVFEGTEPVPVYPEPGLGLEPERAAAALAAGWPPQLGDGGQWRQPSVISLPLTDIHPVTTAEEIDQLMSELAWPAVAGPVTVTTPEAGSFSVSPATIAASLDLTADSRGKITPTVDPEALRDELSEQLTEVETAPVDADVVLASGQPQVVPSQDGTAVDTDALATTLLPVLSEPTPRQAEAVMATVEPGFTTTQAEELEIREQVSTFTSNFDGGLGVPRNHNIATVADQVDGAVVAPGEVFSLNGYTGERGYAQGYQDAPVILDGRLQPAVGGGISQFTTTLFNAAYYAGLEDVEHHPHSYYYSRYPAVIEATIFYPSLDMQFRNDTPYGLLIDTSYNDSSITVSIYSTQVWEQVTTEYSDRRDVTKPETRYVEPDDTCIATTGIDGFTQDAWRVFHRDGVEVKREKFTWRYDAQPEVICGEDPDED